MASNRGSIRALFGHKEAALTELCALGYLGWIQGMAAAGVGFAVLAVAYVEAA